MSANAAAAEAEGAGVAAAAAGAAAAAAASPLEGIKVSCRRQRKDGAEAAGSGAVGVYAQLERKGKRKPSCEGPVRRGVRTLEMSGEFRRRAEAPAALFGDDFEEKKVLNKEEMIISLNKSTK